MNPVNVGRILPNDIAAAVTSWHDNYTDAREAEAHDTARRLATQAADLLATVADALQADEPGIYISREGLHTLTGLYPLDAQAVHHLADYVIPNALLNLTPDDRARLTYDDHADNH